MSSPNPTDIHPGVNAESYISAWDGYGVSTQPFRNKSSLRGLSGLGVGPIPFLPLIGVAAGYMYAKGKKRSKLMYGLGGFVLGTVLNRVL